MKNIEHLQRELTDKIMDIYEIDNYMVEAGYESILPADVNLINQNGLIWYPFEPFLNQINI